MKKGFTLIELLVVISIIGILLALSLFGISNSRESARDAKRKADLELIRSGLEIYKADCDIYPPTASLIFGGSLLGNPPPTSCSSSNTYISMIPQDSLSGRNYAYSRPTETTYTLCVALEKAPVPLGDISGCTSCGVTCNYKVKNP